mmetsp:Transcript_28755/g.92468  ORF Transcript_28755/g.92468 Transcript_28755/m.92468 type:complete len:343 (-) Transcript_28755:252-1280(-)
MKRHVRDWQFSWSVYNSLQALHASHSTTALYTLHPGYTLPQASAHGLHDKLPLILADRHAGRAVPVVAQDVVHEPLQPRALLLLVSSGVHLEPFTQPLLDRSDIELFLTTTGVHRPLVRSRVDTLDAPAIAGQLLLGGLALARASAMVRWAPGRTGRGVVRIPLPQRRVREVAARQVEAVKVFRELGVRQRFGGRLNLEARSRVVLAAQRHHVTLHEGSGRRLLQHRVVGRVEPPQAVACRPLPRQVGGEPLARRSRPVVPSNHHSARARQRVPIYGTDSQPPQGRAQRQLPTRRLARSKPLALWHLGKIARPDFLKRVRVPLLSLADARLLDLDLCEFAVF